MKNLTNLPLDKPREKSGFRFETIFIVSPHLIRGHCFALFVLRRCIRSVSCTSAVCFQRGQQCWKLSAIYRGIHFASCERFMSTALISDTSVSSCLLCELSAERKRVTMLMFERFWFFFCEVNLINGAGPALWIGGALVAVSFRFRYCVMSNVCKNHCFTNNILLRIGRMEVHTKFSNKFDVFWLDICMQLDSIVLLQIVLIINLYKALISLVLIYRVDHNRLFTCSFQVYYINWY